MSNNEIRWKLQLMTKFLVDGSTATAKEMLDLAIEPGVFSDSEIDRLRSGLTLIRGGLDELVALFLEITKKDEAKNGKNN